MMLRVFVAYQTNGEMKFSKKRFTKWVALGSYNFAGTDFVTFCRKNTKSGMMQFKTKRVNGWIGTGICRNSFLPPTLIDTQRVWNEITTENYLTYDKH